MSGRQGRERRGGSRAGLASRLGIFRRLKGYGGVSVGLLLLIWVGFGSLPESSGVAFGLLYQVFFSVIVLLGAAVFWLLGRDQVPQPKSSLGILGSVALVYLITVGFMVAAGIAMPQFEGAASESDVPLSAAARGEAIFWRGQPACILCHSIDGRGVTRAPDLSDVVSLAGERVPGLSAEEYLLEKIKAGLSYEYTVPAYSPIMPPFRDILTDEEISDVIEYLRGPR